MHIRNPLKVKKQNLDHFHKAKVFTPDFIFCSASGTEFPQDITVKHSSVQKLLLQLQLIF